MVIKLKLLQADHRKGVHTNSFFFGSKLKGINDNTQSFNAFESRVRNLLTTTESDRKRLKVTKCATKIEVVAHNRLAIAWSYSLRVSEDLLLRAVT